MKTDIEISQSADLWNIKDVAQKINIPENQLEQYGNYKAKVSIPTNNQKTKRKLILVTSINPTSAGEGKTTVTIGLGDGFTKLGERVCLALREPSLGPVMGIKGGATGGGKSQVVPMEDINLHFTGDFHALTEANNTLAALIDNHIQHGNELNIDPRQIIWKRVLDVNDRELRQVVVGLGGKTSGVPRQDGFDITVASELMAILCLSTDIDDLKYRISNILIGYTYDNQPVRVADLKVQGAITLLLKDAIKPNLVQTLEHTPAFIHGGPFANIAHGCNSILATKASLDSADYTITEAGFGSDLGAEKFMDIVTPKLNKQPDTVVVVATIRALKLNGGMDKNELDTENVDLMLKGVKNLDRHVLGMQQYGKPVIVAINRFPSDTDKEVQALQNYIKDQLHVSSSLVTAWADGGAGATDLASKLIDLCNEEHQFYPIYDVNESVEDKILAVTKKIYGGNKVDIDKKAMKVLDKLAKMDANNLPICIAKTQYSFSDDPQKLNAPSDFTIHVKDIVPKLGAGFIVVMTGNILTMPGLPTHPAALNMDIDNNGKITGLF
ncbi:formate--tetrahydrofolate ligase [Lentilactobacillus laojiaonis]|uniref:formate--tetrahydrofolate ligase n=1 Tax=Lentilactobacillus laojiaonis TaxID=2883998 RepID=UPI001D0A63AC|nr:formate--tetrahydrofolate ligase [Lentilactobacillus laojiaonis]UDM32721.1 formate--tetrahydrofolate ligase [Lentilactobacillus laojiaonis]